MTRQQAVALIQYISRAHGMIPTTGAEWDILRPVIEMIENAANGKGTLTYTGESEGKSTKAELKSV